MTPYSDRVHGWFGLTYSSYLVLNRTLLDHMPADWQERFVTCLEELDAAWSHKIKEMPTEYMVTPRGRARGQFIAEPIPHYRRDRQRGDWEPRPAGEVVA